MKQTVLKCGQVPEEKAYVISLDPRQERVPANGSKKN